MSLPLRRTSKGGLVAATLISGVSTSSSEGELLRPITHMGSLLALMTAVVELPSVETPAAIDWCGVPGSQSGSSLPTGVRTAASYLDPTRAACAAPSVLPPYS